MSETHETLYEHAGGDEGLHRGIEGLVLSAPGRSSGSMSNAEVSPAEPRHLPMRHPRGSTRASCDPRGTSARAAR
jgi:hypothetical protein